MSTQQLPEGYLDVFAVAALPSTHSKVVIERGGKAIHTTTEQGFLCFGQYRRGYPTIPLQAVFSVLIDNNAKDDRYIFILDVYDHHSDRVLGKRVLTRKDFSKANEFCVFHFDFTPPSQEANMEFRIYYMGHAYTLADKIAVIDPEKVTITEAIQIPDVILPEPEEEEESELPAPWKIAKIGNGDGKVSHYTIIQSEIDRQRGELAHLGSFTIEATGAIQGGRDDMYFIYLEWTAQSGNGKVVAKFAQQEGVVGLMFREKLEPGSRFIMLEKNRCLYRETPGGQIREKVLFSLDKPVRGLKFIRKRSGNEQFFTILCSETREANLVNNLAYESIEFTLSQHVYVGLAAGTGKATVDVGMDYKDAAYRV